MKRYQEPSPDDYVAIAEKVRSGEYFREAHSMFDVFANDPMAERNFYLFVTGVAFITFLSAFSAMHSLYPLSRTVPFVYALNDVLQDMPHIAPLRTSPLQSVDDAVLFFMAGTYISQYEGYDITKLERNYSGIEHTSTPEVFAGYQRLLQINNPESPVALYQRHSVRTIDVVSTVKNDASHTLDVIYDASVTNAENTQKTRYKATIGYQYSGVEFDTKADRVKPVSFIVNSYTSKIIQDRP